LAYCIEGCFEGCHFHLAGSHISEVLLCVIALDIDDDAVGEFKAVAVVGGYEGFLFEHAAGDHRVDFGVLCFYGRAALIEQWYLPVASSAGPLASYDELGRFLVFFVGGVCYDSGHYGADKTDSHNDNDFFTVGACGVGERFNSLELGLVLVLGRDGELVTLGTYRILGHSLSLSYATDTMFGRRGIY